ncbi:hypothetical protein KIW84_057109 [Lathyrus oleraceus]|uniref:Uncharacterized protein n=1 Tax=Pisum sativum TaxID=3888 RepID=A0A9D4X299_PEA|nr:hypothetical protein KIW84_057109 [Pisum sativum]
MDLGFFPYTCFKFVEDLRSQKIDGLISMHDMYYPELVKVFYTNMTYEDEVLSSFVKGVPINFSAVELGHILDIPSEGLEIMMNKSVAYPEYVKKDSYYGISRLSEHEFFHKRKKMLGGKIPVKNSWSAGIFHIDERRFCRRYWKYQRMRNMRRGGTNDGNSSNGNTRILILKENAFLGKGEIFFSYSGLGVYNAKKTLSDHRCSLSLRHHGGEPLSPCGGRGGGKAPSDLMSIPKGGKSSLFGGGTRMTLIAGRR